RQFKAKSLQIKTDIPNDLPHVYADPDRVRQLLLNLLDNAAKYTPVGGTIDISALHRTTQTIQVTICDSGPGIPKENQERIFEDQFRLKRDEETEGYGIGLSLCQRIVRAHYGQIWVDSSLGQGSSFHFTLPVISRYS
ncbi:MAG: histidine kinase, partial [Merismopedia sp. SIO2A8]|nr:histidine kinase [Merismopedia sp. SIO2A8]